MFVLVAALVISTLATFGSSASAPTPVAYKGPCSTIYPSSLKAISSTEPDKVFEINNDALTVQQDQTNANTPARTLQYVEFEVPHGPEVWGCQLHVADKNKVLTWTNSTVGQKAPAMNVIGLQPNCDHDDISYDSVINADPSIISARYFGYFALTPGGQWTINSEACPELTSDGKNGHLSFVIEYEFPTWTGNMKWSLPQQVSGDDISGIYMSYGDCWT